MAEPVNLFLAVEDALAVHLLRRVEWILSLLPVAELIYCYATASFAILLT